MLDDVELSLLNSSLDNHLPLQISFRYEKNWTQPHLGASCAYIKADIATSLPTPPDELLRVILSCNEHHTSSPMNVALAFYKLNDTLWSLVYRALDFGSQHGWFLWGYRLNHLRNLFLPDNVIAQNNPSLFAHV